MNTETTEALDNFHMEALFKSAFELRFSDAPNYTTRQRQRLVKMLSYFADGKVFTGIVDGHKGVISAYFIRHTTACAMADEIKARLGLEGVIS
jgi:hypothetical protein